MQTDVYKYIVSFRGKWYQRIQEPYIKFITLYTRDGIATDLGITAKPERMKKARRLGLCQERKIFHIEDGAHIANPKDIDIQKGCYQLMYYIDKNELHVFQIN